MLYHLALLLFGVSNSYIQYCSSLVWFIDKQFSKMKYRAKKSLLKNRSFTGLRRCCTGPVVAAQISSHFCCAELKFWQYCACRCGWCYFCFGDKVIDVCFCCIGSITSLFVEHSSISRFYALVALLGNDLPLNFSGQTLNVHPANGQNSVLTSSWDVQNEAMGRRSIRRQAFNNCRLPPTLPWQLINFVVNS